MAATPLFQGRRLKVLHGGEFDRPTDRGENWSDHETHILLQLWGRPETQHEIASSMRNLGVFHRLAKELHAMEPRFKRTAFQCRSRIKRLKRDFHKAKRDETGILQSRFRYFQELEELQARARMRCGVEGSNGQKGPESSDHKQGLARTGPLTGVVKMESLEEVGQAVSERDNEFMVYVNDQDSSGEESSMGEENSSADHGARQETDDSIDSVVMVTKHVPSLNFAARSFGNDLERDPKANFDLLLPVQFDPESVKETVAKTTGERSAWNVLAKMHRAPEETVSAPEQTSMVTVPRPDPSSLVNDKIRRGLDVEVTNLVVTDDVTSAEKQAGKAQFSQKIEKQTGTFKVKAGLAQMTKGGIIMDVTTPEEARIAEEAGACAVMALERVPADIRRQGGVARMTDPKKIKEIMAAVTIPVMAKCRIGHFAEAQILEALGVDMVDESEVLTPADEENHVDKHQFTVPFVCGARDLGEALRRISEGAAMIRTKGDAGTGDVVEAVRHARAIQRQIRVAQSLDATELYNYAKELRVPVDLLIKTSKLGRLPVVNFAAGGLATPADVSLLMQLGVDGVFVGSGIFKSSDPPRRAYAMAQAVTHYKDAKILAELSENLGEAMFGTPANQKNQAAVTSTSGGDKSTQKIWDATLARGKFEVQA